MLFERGYNFVLAPNYPTSIVDVTKKLWGWRDVEPRNKLVIAPGKMTTGAYYITNSALLLDLPPDYDPTKVLVFSACATGSVLSRVVNDVYDSKSFIKATDSSAEGIHVGFMDFQMRAISLITLGPSVGVDPVFVQFMMYEQPDLDQAASWKDGAQTIGRV